MASESGLFPTFQLRVLLTQRAAQPGDRISLRVDGTDSNSLVRGKLLTFEHERDGDWHGVGRVLAAGSVDVASRWIPPGSPPFAVTLEGYSATWPLYFDVPPLPPRDYRIRFDATHGSADVGNLRERTATLYAPLPILRAADD